MIDKRLMYAQGQRVAKTLDGSRPGYRGSDYGDQARGTGAYSGGPPGNSGDQSTDRSRTTATQDYNTAVATGQNPLGIDMSKGPPDLTPKEIEFNKVTNPFAPNKTKGFNWKSALFNIGLMAINPALAAKYGKAKSLYSGAKYAGKLANDLGLTKTNVVESFTDNVKGFTDNAKNNFTGFNTTGTKGPKDPPREGGDGEGLASLENQAGNYDEYILLLQKLQSGNISDSERNRYNVLKNMLGI
jgi:hypothetical protein